MLEIGGTAWFCFVSNLPRMTVIKSSVCLRSHKKRDKRHGGPGKSGTYGRVQPQVGPDGYNDTSALEKARVCVCVTEGSKQVGSGPHVGRGSQTR